MMTLIIYAGIFMLSIYIAVVSQGYIMALALVVGGIAFLLYSATYINIIPR